MNWHLQDAKNNFSKVVRQAQTEGPQTVTLRGKRTAVVMSAEEYDRIIGNEPKKSFIEHLLAFPELDDETLEVINHRSKTPSRPPIDI
ncbi:type II toxin-antitoxin system Phd/YefM family antitoxin [Mesorhizobium sp. J428]|uniref:type II toxin-antitoxin system Phd/YefM family antitoxin n=1 Tax=Mesorhizobium sp. J428 TaxID=2898440 RepID=UPI0021515E57|nr:type II toxin-antitoxin system Phd/YefM family antitoxin [Mesorhizobium sp. J428]MCR5856937.1 type II toxin-antitoxin system Phd/YefM family antitoxin [Mesorhizobium sp. J428]